MFEWIINNSWAMGVITFCLMWCDWLLTILQERERQLHSSEHYQSYPINTIEGHPLLQSAVHKRRILEPKHIIPALLLSTLMAYCLSWTSHHNQLLFIGFIWGLFLIVDTTHLGNLLGYLAGRRGMHGKIYMHMRTGYLIQAGRYLALAAFLFLLAACSASQFILGIALAGMASAFRQLLFMRRIPAIEVSDPSPIA
jgi:hypothetical protein